MPGVDFLHLSRGFRALVWRFYTWLRDPELQSSLAVKSVKGTSFKEHSMSKSVKAHPVTRGHRISPAESRRVPMIGDQWPAREDQLLLLQRRKTQLRKANAFAIIFFSTIKYQSKVFIFQALCGVPGVLSLSGSRIFHIFLYKWLFPSQEDKASQPAVYGPRAISMCRPSALFQSGQTGVGTEEGLEVMATDNKKGEVQDCQDVATSSSITNFFFFLCQV